MLLRIATSVPSPRSCVPCETPPSLTASNYKEADKTQYFILYIIRDEQQSRHGHYYVRQLTSLIL